MKILGIETATEHLGAALLNESGTFERHISSRSSHCELLSGFITEITEEAGVSVQGIEGVAVSTGPGSFTGLRIGIATAMGLAYGLGIHVASISTLEAIAASIDQPGALVCPVIDAKRSEVYAAIYRTTETRPLTLVEPKTFPVATLTRVLTDYRESAIITGPAARQFQDDFQRTLGGNATIVTDERANPSAHSVARLGLTAFVEHRDIHPAAVEPLYLRRSDAEILRDSRRC